MVNSNKLKGLIVERGMTQKEVYEKLGITRRAFSLRLSNKRFNSDEIYRLIEILNIEDPVPIFFVD